MYFEKGVSLVEILVALLVMSLGLLGMAALQASTSKYRVNVQAHSKVAQLVSNFSEKVRVNPEAAGPSFDPAMGGSASEYVLLSKWSEQVSASLTPAMDCETTVCSASQRAAFDLITWRKMVRDELPQGSAVVQGNRRDGISVTLMWMDKEQTSTTTNADTGISHRSLKKAEVCSDDAVSTIVHNCCPDIAAAPEGVRCLRMSFIP